MQWTYVVGVWGCKWTFLLPPPSRLTVESGKTVTMGYEALMTLQEVGVSLMYWLLWTWWICMPQPCREVERKGRLNVIFCIYSQKSGMPINGYLINGKNCNFHIGNSRFSPSLQARCMQERGASPHNKLVWDTQPHERTVFFLWFLKT